MGNEKIFGLGVLAIFIIFAGTGMIGIHLNEQAKRDHEYRMAKIKCSEPQQVLETQEGS